LRNTTPQQRIAVKRSRRGSVSAMIPVSGAVILQTQNRGPAMIMTTTDGVEGRRIAEYRGLVSGQAILGANFIKDFFAGIRDVVGGRSGSYEKVLRDAREAALEDMAEEAKKLGADAIVGIDLDYETIGDKGSMLMVSANGTAVKLG
jgi:uncharacterized protein YbjQ (UPF0145 family)